MKTYRCALIGLSGIAINPANPSMGGGRSVLPYSHASALAAIPKAEIVAVCDIFPAAGDRFRELWGFGEDELAGHPRVDELVPRFARLLEKPDHAGLVRELVRSATVDRHSRAGRVAFVDGRAFDFAAVPLPDGNALFTMLDVTDRQRAEEALRERAQALEDADRIKTAFVANMSYELRTPLTSIGGFAEMLDGGYAGPLSAEGLDRLVGELLELTKRELAGS